MKLIVCIIGSMVLFILLGALLAWLDREKKK